MFYTEGKALFNTFLLVVRSLHLLISEIIIQFAALRGRTDFQTLPEQSEKNQMC